MASLQEPNDPYISPDRVAHVLGVQLSRLAEIAGVHGNTLANPASERLQDRLRDMVRVIMAASELTGDIEQAIYWFRNEPIVTLKHLTAAELIAGGHTGAVMAHLSELIDGANGSSCFASQLAQDTLPLSHAEAYLPLSGAGAASAGGQFNRPGIEALYLSTDPGTALAEHEQGSSLPRPATRAAYELDLSDVVDLSAGYDADHWMPSWANWNCDWRWIARIEQDAPSRRRGDPLGSCPACCFPRSIRPPALTS